MRLLKFLAKLLMALLAVLLTFSILFLLIPSWQKAVVDEALARDPDRRWDVGSVGLSLFHVEASDIFMLEGMVGAEVERIELSGPFWRSPVSGLIEIESGLVRGFSMDASRLRVGDLTSEDWQSFLKRVRTDPGFWEERTELVLRKLSSTGWEISLTDVILEGQVLMPGETVIPISIRILEADSRKRGSARLRLAEASLGNAL